MKRCNRCKAVKSESDFNRHKGTRDGLQRRCRACQLEANAESIARNPDARRATLKRQYEREKHVFGGGQRPTKRVSPEQKAAHLAVYRAIRSGRMSRPAECERCGAVAPVHGHHEDYSRRLEVVWLCHRCHGRLHADRASDDVSWALAA